MSGYTDDFILKWGIITDKVPFIHKPFTALQLAKKIRGMLDSDN